MYWEYDDKTNTEVSSLILNFREDGYIAMEKRDLKNGSVEERETNNTLKKTGMCFLSLANTYICAKKSANSFVKLEFIRCVSLIVATIYI